MTKFRFMHAGALGALALGLMGFPAQAQDEDQIGSSRGGAAERVERMPDSSGRDRGWAVRREVPAQARAEARSGGGEQSTASARQAPEPAMRARAWGGAARPDQAQQRWERPEAHSDARAADPARQRGDERWAQQRRDRDGGREQHWGGTWASPAERRDAASGGSTATSGWRRDPSYGSDWRRDRREEARDERRDDARSHHNGYRADNRHDHRYDNRWSQNHRRWDHRRWRSDHRYDWYRYRAANRSLFSLGRYYAPYRDYRYSRISIGFHLGSPFYSNRYWINDPWRYRLPDVYGPYRWVRYYDDALLVDIYSGEVVDVIHNFFW